MSGHRLKARDVVFSGVATHFVPRSQVSKPAIKNTEGDAPLINFVPIKIGALIIVLVCLCVRVSIATMFVYSWVRDDSNNKKCAYTCTCMYSDLATPVTPW